MLSLWWKSGDDIQMTRKKLNNINNSSKSNDNNDEQGKDELYVIRPVGLFTHTRTIRPVFGPCLRWILYLGSTGISMESIPRLSLLLCKYFGVNVSNFFFLNSILF